MQSVLLKKGSLRTASSSVIAVLALVLSTVLAACGGDTANDAANPGNNSPQSKETSDETSAALKAFNPGGGSGREPTSTTGQNFRADPSAQRQPANWGGDRDAKSAPQFQRGKLLGPGPGSAAAGGGAGVAPQGDPWAARYPKFRLDKAATIHNWASVSMIPTGIDAFLKTAWTNGNIHIRLAMLGPQHNLETFTQTQNSVKLSFQDKVGTYLKTIVVPISEMKIEHPAANAGTPTLVVEGSMECPLELYEQFYQWVFEWE